MGFHVNDRVVFIGTPGTYVTEWLTRERIPGTIKAIGRGGLVFVSWDGLDARSFYHDHIGLNDVWSVYANQLALILDEDDDVDEPSDCGDIINFFFCGGKE